MKNIILCWRKKYLITALIFIFALLTHTIMYIKIDGYKNVFDTFNDKIFNSFGSEYKNFQDSDAVFVFNEKNYFKNKELKLVLPIECDYTLENGVFSFKASENFTIKSSGDGIVKEVGVMENGLKYVLIKHSNNIYTRYENLKIVGVGKNFLVKNINCIGTSSVDNPLKFMVYNNDKIIENIKIENGEIKWGD